MRKGEILTPRKSRTRGDLEKNGRRLSLSWLDMDAAPRNRHSQSG